MKQTTVMWLQEALEQTILTPEQIMQTIGLFVQALDMEKEQIESAYKEGYDMGYDHGFYEDEPDEEGEKFYYTQTYKSE